QVLVVDRLDQLFLAGRFGLDGLQVALLAVLAEPVVAAMIAPVIAMSERRPAPIERQPADLVIPLELTGIESAIAQLSLQGSLAHSRPTNGARKKGVPCGSALDGRVSWGVAACGTVGPAFVC